MSVDFTSVRNHHEQAVFDAVVARQADFPGVAPHAELLADIACVALNRLPPRYIRHGVDHAFYQSEKERTASQRQIDEAVEYAYGFVQAREAMRARR